MQTIKKELRSRGDHTQRCYRYAFSLNVVCGEMVILVGIYFLHCVRENKHIRKLHKYKDIMTKWPPSLSVGTLD